MKRLEKLYAALKSLDIPVTYSYFKDAVSAPFLTYCVTGEQMYGADLINLICDRTIRIELYTEIKDYQLEKKIEKLFSDVEITKSENYISDERLIQVIYEFSDIFKMNEEE